MLVWHWETGIRAMGMGTTAARNLGSRRLSHLLGSFPTWLGNAFRQRSKTSDPDSGSGLTTIPAAPAGLADIIVSIDAFEHFSDPAAILTLMGTLLKPGGALFASFGPTSVYFLCF